MQLVTDGYTKTENTIVGIYTKIEDSFIDKYLTKDGETLEKAKERLKKWQPLIGCHFFCDRDFLY